MSLATRCPACETTFRVVQDQLKVSGGWVRCGQCHQVFNGLESLITLPPEAVSAAASSAAAAAASEPSAADVRPTVAAPVTHASDPVPDLSDPSSDDEVFVVEDEPVPEATPADDGDEIPTGEVTEGLSAWPEFQSSRRPPDDAPQPAEALAGAAQAAESDAAANATPDAAAESVPGPASDFDPVVSVAPFTLDRPSRFAPSMFHDDTVRAKASPPAAAPLPTPAFVRQAERAARWQRPGMRVALGLLAIVLCGSLAAQVAHEYRDELWARWPASRAPLQQWCTLLQCEVTAPRDLAHLALDSTSLQRTDRAHVLRFEAELRNTASHPVRAPALDVSFQDLQGRTLVRKVLAPDSLQAPRDGVPANGSWHIQAPLDVGELAITGFTAEVFYP